MKTRKSSTIFSKCETDNEVECMELPLNFTFSIINKNQLTTIQKLWEQLNETHLNDSIHFKNYYKQFTFKERCSKFAHIPEDNIRIEIIQENDICIGYCISTINDQVGEIDSVFVEKGFRTHGLGSKLVENSIKWLNKNSCSKIVVSVAAGHESSVLEFYQKFNFYPRMTYLQLME